MSAINTLLCVMGVNLDTLRPEPTVEGHSTAGGYSSRAIRPIALRMIAELAKLRRDEFPDRFISGLGGIETGEDAAQFLLLGADTVQVCTGVMKFGYAMVRQMREALAAFMDRHGFESVAQFKGHSLQYLTTHADLVRRQANARQSGRNGVNILRDGDWQADRMQVMSYEL